MDQTDNQTPFPKIVMHPKRKPWRFLVLLVGIVTILGGSFYAIGRVPAEFIPGTVITIPQGASTKEAGDILERKHVIRSSSIFQFLIKIVLVNRPVIAGDFAFDKPADTLQIARLLTGGGFGGTQARLTFPEGVSIREMNTTIARNISKWNTDEFAAKAKPFEGFLFPETYVVFKTITPDEMIALLKKEYTKKISPLKDSIVQSKKTELQIIIMASLLEKEAKNPAEAKIVAGILWKRIQSGIPLQVDAPFLYTLGKTSSQLTKTDLQKDGPFNTYTRKGLPVGPIGNPGLAMITAAISPESSPYLFYLHDMKGQIHYAKTYQEHLKNKKKYIQ